MKKISATLIMIFTVLVMLSSCGGGTSTSNATAPPPTLAVIKISTQGALASDTLIGSIKVSLLLPAGVTIKTTPDAVNQSVLVPDAGVVLPSGVASVNPYFQSVYSAESGTTPAKVTIYLSNPNGFVVGEVATVNCDIVAGNNPTVKDFSTADFMVYSFDKQNNTNVNSELKAELIAEFK